MRYGASPSLLSLAINLLLRLLSPCLLLSLLVTLLLRSDLSVNLVGGDSLRRRKP